VVTARDAYGNVVVSGDPGFRIVGDASAAALSLGRSAMQGVVTFSLRIQLAGDYVLRVEDAVGLLVHQSKLRVLPGGLSWTASRFLGAPSRVVAGTFSTWLLQVLKPT